MDNGMQLASIDSSDEHEHIENLFKDNSKCCRNESFRPNRNNAPIADIMDEPFWISKSMAVMASNSDSKPSVSTLDSSNQCISWGWTNSELCCALWPLANEWSHEDCSEEIYFICQQTQQIETEMLKVIRDELLTLIDEAMFTEFAAALPTTPESTWISLVEGALQTWLVEQHQISKSATLFDERVDLIAAVFAQDKKTYKTDELKRFVKTKFEMIASEHRVELLSERFRQFIGDLYVDLDPSNQNKSPSDGDIDELLKKVFMLAKVQEFKLASEQLAKMSETAPTDILDEDFMKSISQQLLKFSENEFESYVMDVFAQLEVYGVEEVDMNTLFQLYLLVKQELFSLMAKTVLKATSQERTEIASYVLSSILEGKQLIDEDSVFGQIFVIIATGTTVLLEEKSIHVLDDKTLRTFVKKEFDGLHQEDLQQLKYEGYVKIVMDELIKLVGDINLVKTESGELLLTNMIDLIATQFLLYAEEEMKMLAERMTESIQKESNKLQAVVEKTKVSLSMHDEDKILRLIELIELELGKIVVKTLVNFTEKDAEKLAEEGLSKILAEDRPMGRSSIYAKVFVTLGEKLTKMATDDFAGMRDDELIQFVQSELEKENYAKNVELFEEVYMNVLAEEFIELVEEEAVMLSAFEDEKHQFGEMVKLLAIKLFEIVANEPDYST
ncbi:hypothetical protein HA402_012314 [Bradysia odoriphaga]|nr:hypothetical protein HA402_012314 [Bradysia odoriphaga]